MQSEEPAARDAQSSWCGRHVDAARLRAAGLVKRLGERAATLRADGSAPTRDGSRSADGDGQVRAPWTLKASLPLDASAPGTARELAGRLGGCVAASVVESVQLVVSELVTNSVLHSGAAADSHVRLWIALVDGTVRVEVTDLGGNGAIAPRTPDFERGGGFGLSLVRSVTDRWGLEQSTADGTRVWAQLARGAAIPGGLGEGA